MVRSYNKIPQPSRKENKSTMTRKKTQGDHMENLEERLEEIEKNLAVIKEELKNYVKKEDACLDNYGKECSIQWIDVYGGK